MGALLVTLIILALSASLIYAQGNGNGNRGANRQGRGSQSQSRLNQQSQTDLQLNLYGTGQAQGQGSNGQGGSGQGGSGQSANSLGLGAGLELPPMSTVPLTQDAVTAMNAGILDEYHAFAVYQAVIDQFGSVAPFVNIQAAEAQHIAAWELLFERYGLTAPAIPALEVVPQFNDVSEACTAAAAAEIANFDLYDSAMDTFQDYPDILQIITTLRDVSEFNHLPAFEACAG
jgi:hypothetical protein